MELGSGITCTSNSQKKVGGVSANERHGTVGFILLFEFPMLHHF